MKNIFIPALIVASSNYFSYAQTINTEKLDAYFNELEKHNKFMGSVAVS